MPKLFIKAQDFEECDTVRVFNDRGKEIYYTKDDFIATGHRIKIFLAETIKECGYVQEKAGRRGNKFEFAARDKFGTVSRDRASLIQKYLIDFDESWVLVGDPVSWNYNVRQGSLDIMKVRNQQYLIPGQALNLTNTYILDFDSESDVLIGLAFALSLYAVNKYRY